jgi:hypothetical protein
MIRYTFFSAESIRSSSHIVVIHNSRLNKRTVSENSDLHDVSSAYLSVFKESTNWCSPLGAMQVLQYSSGDAVGASEQNDPRVLARFKFATVHVFVHGDNTVNQDHRSSKCVYIRVDDEFIVFSPGMHFVALFQRYFSKSSICSDNQIPDDDERSLSKIMLEAYCSVFY